MLHPWGQERRSHKTFIPITSIGITVSKYLKQGRPQSDNKTADQQQRGPVGEQKLLVRVIMRIETHQ